MVLPSRPLLTLAGRVRLSSIVEVLSPVGSDPLLDFTEIHFSRFHVRRQVIFNGVAGLMSTPQLLDPAGAHEQRGEPEDKAIERGEIRGGCRQRLRISS